MPAYPWIIRDELDKSLTEKKMKVMVKLGVPYTEEEISNAQNSMNIQAEKIVKNLYEDPDLPASFEESKQEAQKKGVEFIEIKNREIIALIAYLQRLGTDIKVKDLEVSTSQN